MKNVLLLIAATVLCWFSIYMLVGAINSDAREFSAVPSEGSNSSPYDEWNMVKNPDGTYTEYKWFGKDDGGWVRGATYSGEAVSDAETITRESVLELGDTKNVASELEGSTEADRALDEGVEESLRTNAPYTSLGEAAVGDDAIETGIAEGALPSESAVAAGFGTIATGVGVVTVGVALGAGIDYLFGAPEGVEKIEEIFSGETHTEERERNDYAFSANSILGETPYECKEAYSSPATEFLDPYIPHSPGEICLGVRTKGIETHECENVGKAHPHPWERCGGESAFEFTGTGSTEGRADIPGCAGQWWSCDVWNYGSPVGQYWTEQNYVDINRTFEYEAFPGELFGEGKHREGYTYSPPGGKIAAPIKQNELPELQPITKINTLKTTKTKPLEEEHDFGLPVHPHIPPIEKNEEFPKYKERLEKEGYKSITKNVLPEVSIDPNTGPNDVTSADPSPGTEASPSTNVRVDVNPEDAPNPSESPAKVGPPTEPGIHLPTLHLLCTTMPFGVPCWVIKQVEAFSGTAEAPIWKIGSLKILGHTIGPVEIHLVTIEPVMEKIRPWMVLFGIIGIVLMFYRIFTGHSIGGGENPKGDVEPPGQGNSFDDEYDTRGYGGGILG